MNNKASIALYVNGIKTYVRKVMAHKKYTHALVPSSCATRIISCSSTGQFDKDALDHGLVLAVNWIDPRNAEIRLDLTADMVSRMIGYCESQIVVAKNVGNHGAVADYTGYIHTLQKALVNADPAPETEEAPKAKKAKKTKKVKVSTETPEKMMQRFAGQCREMVRKIGYAKAMDLMRDAETAQ